MGQARSVIFPRDDEDLGFVLELAEGFGMDDAVRGPLITRGGFHAEGHRMTGPGILGFHGYGARTLLSSSSMSLRVRIVYLLINTDKE